MLQPKLPQFGSVWQRTEQATRRTGVGAGAAVGSSELAARSQAGGGTGVGDERVDAGEQEAQQVLDLSHADECVMQSVMGY